MDGSNQKCTQSGFGASFLCEGCSPGNLGTESGIHLQRVRNVYNGGIEFKVQRLADCEYWAKKYGARYFSYVEYMKSSYCFYTATCDLFCYSSILKPDEPCEVHSHKSQGWNIYERPAGIIYIAAVYKILIILFISFIK